MAMQQDFTQPHGENEQLQESATESETGSATVVPTSYSLEQEILGLRAIARGRAEENALLSALLSKRDSELLEVKAHAIELERARDATTAALEARAREVSELRRGTDGAEEIVQLKALLLSIRDKETSVVKVSASELEAAHSLVAPLAAQIAQLSTWLKERSREFAGRDLAERQLVIARRRCWIAEHTLRLVLEVEEIAERTGPIQRSAKAIPQSKRILTAIRSRGTRLGGSSIIAMERLWHELRNSLLFNAAWYLSQRQDLQSATLDLVDHFVLHGIDEGTSPNPLVDGAWLAKVTTTDRSAALRNYILYGRRTNLGPNPLFDVSYYREIAGLNEKDDALLHYLHYGRAAGLSPCPLFDSAFYQGQVPILAQRGVDPLVHYLHSRSFMVDPHPLFSAEYYLDQRPELLTQAVPALVHYLEYGISNRSDPHPSFSGAAYLDRYPDVAASGMNPLVHFVRFGKSEGRQIEPVRG